MLSPLRIRKSETIAVAIVFNCRERNRGSHEPMKKLYIKKEDEKKQWRDQEDRAEFYDLKSRFLLFILVFFFPLFFRGEEKRGKE